MSIYDYTATLENGQTYSLKDYQGKVLLIVNTATKCGFTPQFAELETLYQTYQKEGLVVLGFPSNQFKQELESGQEAAEACRMTYGVTFPMHQLTVLNGEKADPLFAYLTSHSSGLLGDHIKWNFTKFLINRKGEVVKRFAPKDKPSKMIPDIEALLAE